MTVRFYEVKAMVTFNGLYEKVYTGPFDNILDNVSKDMDTHNFCEAEVVDFYTGELLAEIKG